MPESGRAGVTGCATCRLPVNTALYGCSYDRGGRAHHDVCLRWAEAHPGQRIRLTKDEEMRRVQ